jgi:hypothetical protein
MQLGWQRNYMSKQLIYFVFVIMLASALGVSAQESIAALNGTDASNTASNVSLNETINTTTSKQIETNSSEILSPSVQNETTPVQNETAAVQDDTASIKNETTAAQGITAAIQNETTMAQNATLPENITSDLVQVNDSLSRSKVAQPEGMSAESSENTIFAIGNDRGSKDFFPINGDGEPKKAYEIGLATKPIRDVSKMFFSCNII